MSEVVLNIYDLTQGLAAQFAPALGVQIDGIWHTGIVVFGSEFFFGGGGIFAMEPATTPYGVPTRRLSLGATRRTKNDFLLHISHTLNARFGRLDSYSLTTNNCNHFTQACCEYLLPGSYIPSYILNQAELLLSTPIGQMLAPFISSFDHKFADFANTHTDVVHSQEVACAEAAATMAALDNVSLVTGKMELIVTKINSEEAKMAWNSDMFNSIDSLQQQLPLLERLVSAAAADEFAVVDVARLALAHAARLGINFTLNENLRNIATCILVDCDFERLSLPRRLMTLRTGVNLFALDGSSLFIQQHLARMLELAAQSLNSDDKQRNSALEISAAALILNATKFLIDSEDCTTTSHSLDMCMTTAIDALSNYYANPNTECVVYLLSALLYACRRKQSVLELMRALELDLTAFANATESRVLKLAQELKSIA